MHGWNQFEFRGCCGSGVWLWWILNANLPMRMLCIKSKLCLITCPMPLNMCTLTFARLKRTWGGFQLMRRWANCSSWHSEKVAIKQISLFDNEKSRKIDLVLSLRNGFLINDSLSVYSKKSDTQITLARALSTIRWLLIIWIWLFKWTTSITSTQTF